MTILVHIEVTDKDARRVLDGFTGHNNIAMSVEGEITPEVQAAFMQAQVENYVLAAVAEYEARQAEIAARTAANESVKSVKFSKGK